MLTPAKSPHRRLLPRSPNHQHSDYSENIDPNVRSSNNANSKTPSKTSSTSSASKLRKVGNPRSPPPPPPPAAAAPRERKFIIAKKTSRPAAVAGGDSKKGLEAAYEALRRSQEDFFRKRPDGINDDVVVQVKTERNEDLTVLQELENKKNENQITLQELENKKNENQCVLQELVNEDEKKGTELQELEGCTSEARKSKSCLMEEAMNCLPEPGSGRVKQLVKAFESLLVSSKEVEENKAGDSRVAKVMNWPLPGLQSKTAGFESSVSVFSSAEFVLSKTFKRDPRLYASLDSNGERLSWGSRTSEGGWRSRRNSTDSSGRCWNKKLKVTSQKPFKLRTEQRGRVKMENFIKKVQEMFMEEEKQRIPIAQGLPWTTDEPECLVRPPVKHPTEPLDVILHSDVRAVERSEFDNYVSERISFAEQLKLERERQRKLEEEEEIRRLRRELVPKAQPMPYFDRPFVPKKSSKPRTVPKEPRFHFRQHTQCNQPLSKLFET